MKKTTSQVFVAIVCALLGFLLAYQFKALTSKEQGQNQSIDKTNIIEEIDSLKKEKESLSKVNAELSDKLKELEESAAKNGEVDAEIKKQLDSARMVLGTEDVTGPGVTIILTPKSSIFAGGNEAAALTEEELTYLINMLWFARAQAISINGFRITPQTGIKSASNYLNVGDAGKLNPREKVEIKAIGDKNIFKAALDFKGALDYNALRNFTPDIKYSDDIVIEKTTQSLKSDHLRPIKKKE
ncbi:MAG: DUF881 domain-containing protein [Clostridium sp.]